MKCRDDSCSYCTIINPPRLPHDVFEQLSFLPDPVLGCNRRFKPFTEVYGTDTSDSDRPSLHNKPELTERDKKFKSMFVAGWFQTCFNAKKFGIKKWFTEERLNFIL